MSVSLFDFADALTQALSSLARDGRSFLRLHGLLKGRHRVDGLIVANGHVEGAWQRAVGECIHLARRHGAHERLNERRGSLGRGLTAAQLIAKRAEIDCGIAVQRRRVKAQALDHGRAGVIFGSAVIHSRKVVVFHCDRVDRNCMSHLGRGVGVEVWGIGEHAPEQRDVNRLHAMEHFRYLLFHGCGGLLVIKPALNPVDNYMGQSIELGIGDENQVLGYLTAGLRAHTVRFFRFNTRSREHTVGKLLGPIGKLGLQLNNAIGNHPLSKLGPHTKRPLRQKLGEKVAHRMLPSLARDTSTTHATVKGCLGTSRIIAVDVARGNILNCMDVKVEHDNLLGLLNAQ